MLRAVNRVVPARATSLVLLALLVACDQPPPPAWAEAFAAQDVGWLLNVWASGPDDVWAVGGTPSEGVVMHYDGSTWSSRSTRSTVPLLDWTFGFAPDDVWCVGQGGTILHWDGDAFTAESSGTTENLWGIWGDAPDDLWAVGGSGQPESTATLLHRDESGWAAVALPTLQRTGVHAFFKVWGSSASDVWVVGQRGVVLHYDGASWTERLAGTGLDLIAVWGTGPDHAVLVGGRGNGVAILWDGVGFTPIPTDLRPGLNGVWMDRPGVIHVAGVAGTRFAMDETGHVLRDDTIATSQDFHSVFGVPGGGPLYAVGGNFVQPMGPYRGIATRRARGGDE